jgi:hypothetical protein
MATDRFGSPIIEDRKVDRFGSPLLEEVPTSSPMPSDQTFEAKPSDEPDFGKVPESTAYGITFGLATPEILQRVVSPALQAFPYTRPLGVGTYVAGEALKGRRLASGFTGGLEAGAGESAVQLSKALGAPEYLQTAAGLVFGAGTPTVLGALGRNIPVTREMLRAAEKGGFKEAGQRFASRIRGDIDEFDISAQQRVIRALEDEAGRIKQTGQQRANEIMGKAEADIARLAPGAEAQAAQIRQRARDEAAATLFAARQQADQRAIEIRQIENRARQATQRFEGRVPQAQQAIGQPAEMTDIGNALRQKILSVQGDAIAKRKKDYDDGKLAVAEEVAKKESRGDFVRDRADFKAILEEAKQRGGIGKAVLETPQMVAATPQLRSFYKQLFSMLSGKSAQQEIEGKATGALNLDFNQIDEVRRLLGDSFSKPVAEGYTSLQQKAERDLYMRLSEILGNYSPKKKDLISTYKDESQGLNIFKTAKGKKATATDAYNDSAYVTDPSQLPKAYFVSRTGVEDLIQLTGGDRNLVEQQAKAFVARQLQQAKTADQVRGFQDNYSELFGVFPDLGRAVNQFADQLAQTARVTGRVGELQKSLRTELKTLPDKLTDKAQKEATRITKAGDAEAKAALGTVPGMRTEAGQTARQAQAEANKMASMLTRQGNQSRIAFFDQLATSGDTPRLLAAAPAIKSNPQILNDFVEGLRSSLSRIDPVQLPSRYGLEIEPSLLEAGLITPQQAKQIADQVRLVGMTADPSALPIRTANLIKSAIVANLGMGSSRLMDSLGLSFTEPFLGGQ